MSTVVEKTPHPFQPERAGLNIRRQAANGLAIVLTTVFAAAASVFLLYLIFYIAQKGIRSINLDFFTQAPAAIGDSGGGIGPAIIGTLIIVGLAALAGIPLGMATGIYLAEIGRGRFAGLVRFLVDTLTGIPTILFGLFAWVLIVVPSHSFSAISGSVALSIIMIPTVARATEEVLRLVPKELREASVALGATESHTILRIVVPAARSGIVTGIMLAVARVAGETAPLALTAFGSPFFNTNIFRATATIPKQTFDFILSPYSNQSNQAYSAALLLIVLVILTSFAVRWATGGFRRPGGR
ncbi:MAG: phosphate ABC transporter permease PstA [Ktedonobacterales bacterium]|nr:phosphate ABC transporter permease PstA [Ktedonobacterales bacterium]